MVNSGNNFRATLQLPKTDFPMRAGLPQREPEWLQRWEKIKVYDRLRERSQGRPTFVLHDGPPYANGHLHIGHALNKILKDIIVRSQQMMGKDSRYVPGWDCHGLPIEWKIEEQYLARKAAKSDVPIIELRDECRQFAEKWIAIQQDEFRRMGVTGDWKNPYLTMDYDAESVIASEFMKFVMNGILYQGFKPVLWSTVEKTALAGAEVEYKEHQTDAVWVRFPIDREKSQGSSDLVNDACVLIWTTTPWTLPSNRAICFNSNIHYSLYEVDRAPDGNHLQPGMRLLIADNLALPCMDKARVDSFSRLRKVSADEIQPLVCKHPLAGMVEETQPEENRWDFPVPLIDAKHVTDDDGTGFVHTAPSHGDDDYLVGLKHGLVMSNNIEEDGRFRSDLPIFGDHAILQENGKEGSANRTVIKALTESAYLAARQRIHHSYPHSWRSKAPLIYRSTSQWFAAIDQPICDGMEKIHGQTIRHRALNAIENAVQWTPPTGRNRLYSMIENRPDWVLSRQRAWGVPLTCFTKKGSKPDDDDFILRDAKVNERIVEAFRKEGANAWYREGAKARFLGPDYDPQNYDQVFDILDVWFDSGSTHAFVLRDRKDGPSDGIADLYLEGTDQHRGWFQSSLLQSCGTRGEAPYRGVLTHGFTLDEKGRKMAKSEGNTIAPEDIIRTRGADILRLWVAQSDYRTDLRIGPEILKGVTDSYRRIRNCFRFMLGNLFDYHASDEVGFNDLPELERWVLHRLAELDQQVRQDYTAYDFQRVFQSLFNFVNSDLSSFYFDIRKDTLYCDSANGPTRRAAQTVLDKLHRHLTIWLAPILAFTAEDIWLSRFSDDESSVHLQDFPPSPSHWLDPELATRWETIRRVRRTVTSALEIGREKKIIGSSLQACPAVYLSDPSIYDLLSQVQFADVCITSDICLKLDTAPKTAFSFAETPGVSVQLEMASGHKCPRCWKVLPEVKDDATVCERCHHVLAELNVE